MEKRYVKSFEQYISTTNNDEQLDEGLFGGKTIVDLKKRFEAPINPENPSSDNRMVNLFKKGYKFPGWDGSFVRKPKDEKDATAMEAYNKWANSPAGQAYNKFWKLVEEDGKIDKYEGEIKGAGNVVPGKSFMYIPSMYIKYPNVFAAGRSATGAATSGMSGSPNRDEKAEKALEYVLSHADKYGVKYADANKPTPTVEHVTVLKFADFIKG